MDRASTGFSAADYDNHLSKIDLENWDDGGEISRFAYLRTSQVFPAALVHRAGAVSALEHEPSGAVAEYPVTLADGRRLTFDQLVTTLHTVDGFAFVHQGRLVYERYPRMSSTDKHLLFSVTKAFVSTLVALLEARGLIVSARPIETYLPELARTAWEGICVRDILDMASGIAAPDGGIDNPKSEHYRLEASYGWLPLVDELAPEVKAGHTHRYLRSLGRGSAPGIERVYSSANTAVLTWLVEAVTGQKIYDVLAEEIWAKIGAESDALWVVNRQGVAVSHAGLVMTVRDLARFGLLFTPSYERVTQEHVIPEWYRAEIVRGRPGLTEPSAPFPKELRVGAPGAYQWDRALPDGSFFKTGYAGQLLHVSATKDLVVAYVSSEEFVDTRPPFQHVLHALVDDVF